MSLIEASRDASPMAHPGAPEPEADGSARLATHCLVSSGPDSHVRKIKAMQQLGATAIVVMNISGTDPLGMLRTYREHVLPQLRGS